jgi:hypothetical protein
MLTVGLPAVAATGPTISGTTGVGPVTNGDLEQPFAPDPVVEPLRGSVVDSCFGIGHQVLFGSDSTQSEITGAEPYSELVPPTDEDPATIGAWAEERIDGLSQAPSALQDRGEAVLEDPENEAQEERRDQIGPDSCVWGPEDGYDVVYLTPVERTQQPVHWSMNPNNPGVVFGYGFDDDPLNRAALFPDDPTVSNFNMWQWAGSPHQAWSANVDAFEFDVLNDASIHDEARFQLILTPIPLGSQAAEPTQLQDTAYNDCSLTFDGEQLRQATNEDGHVAASPVEASFASKSERCEHLEQAWTEADDEETKRSILGQVRINQLNFNGWNLGQDPIVIDNIELSGASTAAEELARGNARITGPS